MITLDFFDQKLNAVVDRLTRLDDTITKMHKDVGRELCRLGWESAEENKKWRNLLTKKGFPKKKKVKNELRKAGKEVR